MHYVVQLLQEKEEEEEEEESLLAAHCVPRFLVAKMRVGFITPLIALSYSWAFFLVGEARNKA